MFNPPAVFIFLFCAVVVVMVAIFAGAPAIWWALGVWACVVAYQVV